MKKGLLCLVSVLLLFSVASCRKENEAPLQFDVVENSDSTEIRVYYHSSDMGPGIVVKEYFVHSYFTSGELLLECNNSRHLDIETRFDKPCVLETGGSSLTESTAEETGIFVTLENDNQLRIRFEDRTDDNIYAYYGDVKVFGKVGGKDEVTKINISRSKPFFKSANYGRCNL